jgi:hypothetical protein
LELKEHGPAFDLTFLKGNHEDMFLSYLGLPGNYGEMFFQWRTKTPAMGYLQSGQPPTKFFSDPAARGFLSKLDRLLHHG